MARQGGTSDPSTAQGNGGIHFSESSFERVVVFLKLSPEQYVGSSELRAWVLQNKDHKYVPPDLLKAFGFQVNLEP